MVGDANADGFGHGVVGGVDGVFGDVGAGLGDLAVLVRDRGALDVFAFDDGEGFHDVLDGVARCGEHLAEQWAFVAPFFGHAEIQLKVRGIQLAPQQKPTLFIFVIIQSLFSDVIFSQFLERKIGLALPCVV